MLFWSYLFCSPSIVSHYDLFRQNTRVVICEIAVNSQMDDGVLFRKLEELVETRRFFALCIVSFYCTALGLCSGSAAGSPLSVHYGQKLY